MIVLGGTNDLYPLIRAVPEALGCVLLAAAILSPRSRWEHFSLVDGLAIAVVALLIVQLVPLPPALWTIAPGREFVLATDNAVFGMPIWRSISLQPDATLLCIVTLLPTASVYVAMRTAPAERQVAILGGFGAALIAAIMFALAQRMTSRASWLYPYEMSDAAFVIAFFTNHNHFATFLLACLPLAAIGFVPLHPLSMSKEFHLSSAGWAVGLCIILLVLFCVLATGSRAGLAITPVAIGCWLLVGLIALHRSLGRYVLLPLVAMLACGVGAVLMLQAGIIDIDALSRGRSLSGDRRFEIWPVAAEMVRQFFPFGSGFGSFAAVYGLFEPRETITGRYVNHAHSDYLEIIAEGGVVALIILLLLLGWLTRCALSIVRSTHEGTAKQASLIATALCLATLLPVLLHSLVDYPLRTAANSMCAACAIALLVRLRMNWVDAPKHRA